MAKDILRYPGWMYAYGIASKQLSMEEAKVEYQRIYHALRQRQRRLLKSEFAGSKFATKKLIPLKEIKTERQFLEQLQSLAGWARGRQTSISGLREYKKDVAEFLDTYGGEDGKSFKDFTAANWTEFGIYMRRVHKAQYDSEKAVAMFRVAKEAGMTGSSLYKDFSYWREHQDDLNEYIDKGAPLGGRASSKRIRDYIEKH